MASTDDWRNPDKRRIIIKQLEDAVRHCPSTPPNLQNPEDVEKIIFERSKGEEDYSHKIRAVILMLTKHKAVVPPSQPPPSHLPPGLDPMAASHGPAYSMGGPVPGGMQGMNPNAAGMMNRVGLPSQQPQQHYYQMPQMQHVQPPQYPMAMQQQGGMVVTQRPMPGGAPMTHNPAMMTPQQGYQHTHAPQPMPGQAYQLQQPHMGYTGGMPPGYTRGVVAQPGGMNPMVVSRPPLRSQMAVAMGGQLPGRATPMGVGGGGMVQPASMVQQPVGMAMGGGGAMMGSRPSMSPYGAYPEQVTSGVQSVTAVPNPSYPMPGGGVRPPSVPPYSGVQGPGRSTGVPSPYSALTASPGPAPSISSAVAPPPDPTASQPPTSSAPPSTAGNPPTPHPPSQSVPSPAPPTPILGPISPATGLGSPAAQPTMTPEENEAYLRKLQELQKHIPLLSRMLSRLSKQPVEDNKRNDQYVKLRSLYNLLQDQNRRVPLPTLQKCAQVLEKISDQDRNKNKDHEAPPTPSSAVASLPTSSSMPAPPPSSAIDAPPPAMTPFKPPPEPSKSPSLMSFKMIPSPPPTCSNLLETIRAKPLPAERLPPAKRLCNREESALSPSLMRELSHLAQFKIHRLPQRDKFDRAVILECSLSDDGLPQVPSLTIRIPPNYPLASPECDLAHYQDSSPFLHEVGRLLSDRLARSSSNYTLSSLLSGWETSVLRAVANELSTQEE